MIFFFLSELGSIYIEQYIHCKVFSAVNCNVSLIWLIAVIISLLRYKVSPSTPPISRVAGTAFRALLCFAKSLVFKSRSFTFLDGPVCPLCNKWVYHVMLGAQCSEGRDWPPQFTAPLLRIVLIDKVIPCTESGAQIFFILAPVSGYSSDLPSADSSALFDMVPLYSFSLLNST